MSITITPERKEGIPFSKMVLRKFVFVFIILNYSSLLGYLYTTNVLGFASFSKTKNAFYLAVLDP